MMPAPWGISAGGNIARLPVVTGGIISPMASRASTAQVISQAPAVAPSAARIITMLVMKKSSPRPPGR